MSTAQTGEPRLTEDPLVIGGRTLHSRLLLGSGGFPPLELLAEAIAASGCEIVTVALRRVDPGARSSAGRPTARPLTTRPADDPIPVDHQPHLIVP